MNLKKWLQKNKMSLIQFENLSGVPYQRISEHIRLNTPLSEDHVLLIIRATNREVAIESLRPQLKEILQLCRS
jgi:DNA-binding transcriptional regulator YdaS (Cro superfamily)